MDLGWPELRHLIDIGRKSRPASQLFPAQGTRTGD